MAKKGITDCLMKVSKEVSEHLDETSAKIMDEIIGDLREKLSVDAETELNRATTAEEFAKAERAVHMEKIDTYRRQVAAPKIKAMTDKWITDPNSFLNKAAPENVLDEFLNFIEQQQKFLKDKSKRATLAEGESRRAGVEDVAAPEGVGSLHSQLLVAEETILEEVADALLQVVYRKAGILPTMHKNAELVYLRMGGYDITDYPGFSPESIREAEKAAAMIQKVTRKYFTRMHDAGIVVPFMEDWAPQKWSLARIEADLDGFRTMMKEHLSPKYHPDPDSTIDKMLRDMSKGKDLEPGKMLIQMSRGIYFKDAKSAWQMISAFGEGTFGEMLTSQLKSIGRKTALIEMLGPMPYQMMDQMLAHAEKRAEEALAGSTTTGGVKRISRGDIDSKVRTAQDDMAELSGRAFIPDDINLAEMQRLISNVQVWRLLGSTVDWSIQDLTSSILNTMAIRKGFRAKADLAKDWAKMITHIGDSNMQKEFVKQIGVATDLIVGMSLERAMYASSTPGYRGANRTAKVANAFEQMNTAMFRITGTEQMTTYFRKVVGYFHMKDMATAFNSYGADFAALKEANLTFWEGLREAGFDAKTWKALHDFHMKNGGGDHLDTTRLLADDPKMARFLGSYLRREADHAVAMPGLRTKRELRFNQTPGTKGFFLASAVTQFMAWPLQFYRNITKRGIRRGGQSIATTGLTLWFTGMLHANLRRAFNPEEEMLSLDNPLLMIEGFADSSIAFLYSDTASEIMRQFITGTTFDPDKLLLRRAGPAAQTALDLAKLSERVTREIQKTGTIGPTTLSALTNFGLRQTPARNIFYKFLWDSHVRDMLDNMDGNRIARRERHKAIEDIIGEMGYPEALKSALVPGASITNYVK